MIAKIFGINRLKVGTDGPGVTTLVGMYKCPLNCEYCINNPITKYEEYSVEDLYDAVSIDDLYFNYTGGGICFGGHEAMLQQQFILEFIKYIRKMKHKWKIGIETCFNCKVNKEVVDALDYIIIDIKSMDNDIYKSYTERPNDTLISNLKEFVQYSKKIFIRVPIIPGYNDYSDVEKSIAQLIEIGYNKDQIKEFTYITEL